MKAIVYWQFARQDPITCFWAFKGPTNNNGLGLVKEKSQPI
jgi:hypothetical protein